MEAYTTGTNLYQGGQSIYADPTNPMGYLQLGMGALSFLGLRSGLKPTSGCFVAGTLVSVASLPVDPVAEQAIWSIDHWSDGLDESEVSDDVPAVGSSSLVSGNAFAVGSSVFNRNSLASRSSASTINDRILVPIEEVPLGARISTKNPRPWEYDDSLPEPVQKTWVKISLTVSRHDGGIVDVELIRPRLWLQAFDISVGKPLPLNIHELQIEGFALVTAIEPCPAISSGEGSVVTGRFVTRQVHCTIRLVVANSTGHTETIEGTAIHPFWSLDRLDWVPMGDLIEGERLSSATGSAVVRSSTIANHSVPVYNVEVNGEHVYDVGEIQLLVHNMCAAKPLTPAKHEINATYKNLIRNREAIVAARAARIKLGSQLGAVDDVGFDLVQKQRLKDFDEMIVRIENEIESAETTIDLLL
ncbi:MAG: polymorphic toxin-type HINT domain-containing protein [Pirellulaceae bacterium]